MNEDRREGQCTATLPPQPGVRKSFPCPRDARPGDTLCVYHRAAETRGNAPARPIVGVAAPPELRTLCDRLGQELRHLTTILRWSGGRYLTPYWFKRWDIDPAVEAVEAYRRAERMGAFGPEDERPGPTPTREARAAIRVQAVWCDAVAKGRLIHLYAVNPSGRLTNPEAAICGYEPGKGPGRPACYTAAGDVRSRCQRCDDMADTAAVGVCPAPLGKGGAAVEHAR